MLLTEAKAGKPEIKRSGQVTQVRLKIAQLLLQCERVGDGHPAFRIRKERQTITTVNMGFILAWLCGMRGNHFDRVGVLL